MTKQQWRFYTFVSGVAQGVALDVLGVAPKVFIYAECKLSTKVHIFIWGGLRGGTRLFGVALATPCHPSRTANDTSTHPPAGVCSDGQV